MGADNNSSDPDIENGPAQPAAIPIPDPFPESEDDSETASRANAAPLTSYRPKPGGSLIMAGMIGLANGLGLEDPRDEIEIAIQFENDEDGLDFDFGELPPL